MHALTEVKMALKRIDIPEIIAGSASEMTYIMLGGALNSTHTCSMGYNNEDRGVLPTGNSLMRKIAISSERNVLLNLHNINNLSLLP